MFLGEFLHFFFKSMKIGVADMTFENAWFCSIPIMFALLEIITKRGQLVYLIRKCQLICVQTFVI